MLELHYNSLYLHYRDFLIRQIETGQHLRMLVIINIRQTWEHIIILHSIMLGEMQPKKNNLFFLQKHEQKIALYSSYVELIFSLKFS